ncbi:protein transport protein SEC23-like [Pistacia vera]|uniref:protein transport protein SEC23-like n=1 Tax=Pistacia vera TaxID=55513 RepID=UPI0012635573|nr:protein transport protein SEC23-like [Pistacia vera]
MANPTQPSVGYSFTATSPNPDTPSPQTEKTPIPRPPISSAPPRFPPPKLQHDPIASPSIRTPNMLSPANGVNSGSPIPHLSTPPGPPVFTSPVRPAAVPFRTSPATPQPVAFSSGSSLPTSSPPHFSNGSAELQHQVPDVIEETSPYGKSSCVLISARKVLKQKKQANVPSLGFGALVSPGREVSPGPQIIQRDPHRCHNCGAYANIYCKIILGSGQWQCVVCHNLNGSEGEYVASSKEELRNFPELSSPMVDYVQTGNNRPSYVPVSDSRMSAPIILVIDECLDEPHLQHLQSSLHAFVESIPPTARIGIILYGRTVSVYDYSEDSIASADVLPGDKSPTQESLKALLYGAGVYLSPMHASKQVAHDIFSSLRPYKLNIPEASRDRCLGTAVEVALSIIQGPTAEMSRGVVKRAGGNSRIIVCAGGPNTYGPGSVPHSFTHPNYPHMEKTALKWMELLGREAHRHNTVIDILCAGTCPVRVPVLQPLAKASGGVLVLHDDFGEAFGVNLQRASTRAAGSHGLLEIRCSDDILVTQVVGPGEEAHLDTHETFKNDTALSIQMLSVEETQSFAVSMENKGDIKSDHVFFQFAIQYSNVYQADISRVVTVRLPTVDNVSAYLESVQDEVVAVLIAKRTLLRAKNHSDAIDMRTTIDERVKDVALKFGSQVPKSKLYRFPKELSALSEILFHLRRGPLLGSIIGHEDERSVLRSLFLNASFELSLRMVAPRCLMHREGGTFEELPAHDLAMQSDKAVVLDHGTDVFIWLGAELAADEGRSAAALAACRTLAEELTESRFPAPRILAFKEGSSQARYFVSRLIPAHKDPPYEQEARFPQLRSLTTEQRTKLKSSFLFFDDPSFCEWMRSLRLVPPEPS